VTSERETAARITGTVWEAVRLSGGLGVRELRHFPGAFEASWAAALPVPAVGGGTGQPAAVPGPGVPALERYDDPAALRAACARRPRTRLLEDIGWGPDGEPWAKLAGEYLTRLAGGPRVTVSVYESAHGDEGFGIHRDGWLGVIVHLGGAKSIQAGPGLAGGRRDRVRQAAMRAGDVTVMPKGMPHLAGTPPHPGWSRHATFALLRSSPAGKGGLTA
jgi:hypothetical protein